MSLETGTADGVRAPALPAGPEPLRPQADEGRGGRRLALDVAGPARSKAGAPQGSQPPAAAARASTATASPSGRLWAARTATAAARAAHGGGARGARHHHRSERAASRRHGHGDDGRGGRRERDGAYARFGAGVSNVGLEPRRAHDWIPPTLRRFMRPPHAEAGPGARRRPASLRPLSAGPHAAPFLARGRRRRSLRRARLLLARAPSLSLTLATAHEQPHAPRFRTACSALHAPPLMRWVRGRAPPDDPGAARTTRRTAVPHAGTARAATSPTSLGEAEALDWLDDSGDGRRAANKKARRRAARQATTRATTRWRRATRARAECATAPTRGSRTVELRAASSPELVRTARRRAHLGRGRLGARPRATPRHRRVARIAALGRAGARPATARAQRRRRALASRDRAHLRRKPAEEPRSVGAATAPRTGRSARYDRGRRRPSPSPRRRAARRSAGRRARARSRASALGARGALARAAPLAAPAPADEAEAVASTAARGSPTERGATGSATGMKVVSSARLHARSVAARPARAAGGDGGRPPAVLSAPSAASTHRTAASGLGRRGRARTPTTPRDGDLRSARPARDRRATLDAVLDAARGRPTRRRLITAAAADGARARAADRRAAPAARRARSRRRFFARALRRACQSRRGRCTTRRRAQLPVAEFAAAAAERTRPRWRRRSRGQYNAAAEDRAYRASARPGRASGAKPSISRAIAPLAAQGAASAALVSLAARLGIHHARVRAPPAIPARPRTAPAAPMRARRRAALLRGGGWPLRDVAAAGRLPVGRRAGRSPSGTPA